MSFYFACAVVRTIFFFQCIFKQQSTQRIVLIGAIIYIRVFACSGQGAPRNGFTDTTDAKQYTHQNMS